ncbi:MAG: hypothetical protein ACLQGV_03210 [Bryobacteraceae bacterium]
MSDSGLAGCKGRNLARFFQLRGWSVAAVGRTCWVSSGTRARWLMNVPDHVFPEAQPEALAALLRAENMFALRYPSREEPGLPAGLYMCRDRNYSIKNVARGFRSAVKGGLARCEVRRVSPDEMLSQGLECNRETMHRQGRYNPEFGDARRWAVFVDAASQVPAIEVTGAFVDGQLAAYQLGCLDDGCWNIAYAFSRSQLLEHHPNHALMYSTLERSLRRPEVEAVCAGPKTVLVQDGLHDFKTRMGFEVEPHQVVVRFHPLLEGLLVSALVGKPIEMLRKARPETLLLKRVQAFLGAARSARNGVAAPELAMAGRNG